MRYQHALTAAFVAATALLGATQAQADTYGSSFVAASSNSYTITLLAEDPVITSFSLLDDTLAGHPLVVPDQQQTPGGSFAAGTDTVVSFYNMLTAGHSYSVQWVTSAPTLSELNVTPSAPVSNVPEAGVTSLTLAGLGLVGLVMARRQRAQA